MFETSVVRAQAVGSRRRYYSLLSVSLVAHTAAILGAVAVSVASVDFPRNAPDQFELLRPVAALTVPPPLGTPEGDGRPKAPPQQAKVDTPPPPAPTQQTAPAVVPDQVPEVGTASTPSTEIGDPNAPAGTGPRGVPGGDPNSVATDLDLPLTTTPQVEDKVYEVSGDVKAPRVIQRVEPRYPQVMIAAKKGATVTTRCIIDRNGNVRDIAVIYSSFPMANESVVAAMQKWRFAPGSLNGRPVDTVFELTVKFSTN